MAYSPDPPVVTVRVELLSRLCATTSAPTTTAPVLSVTVPLIEAVCATERVEKIRVISVVPNRIRRLFITREDRGVAIRSSPVKHDNFLSAEQHAKEGRFARRCNSASKLR